MLDFSEEKKKLTVLAVDDTSDNLVVISAILKDSYRVKAANSGEKALRIAQSEPAPDIILLDIMMPGMDGYEVCRQLKENPQTANIPVIFLTAMSDSVEEEMGLSLGAVDYIIKPFSPHILLARLKTHLFVKASADFLRDQNAYLEQEVQRRTLETQTLQNLTVMVMASLAETRDNETGYHIRRTQHYIKVLAEKLRFNPRFFMLNDRMIELLFKCAPLHDIGKVGIPDKILLKSGRLDVDEFEVMKGHSFLGYEAISHVEKELGISVDFLSVAKDIVLSHHEKWDGSGYPSGLSGEQIPVGARLMAVADVYDALISERPYKKAIPHEKAVGMIIEGRGTHFDPDVVDAFVELQDVFAQIAQRFADKKRVAE